MDDVREFLEVLGRHTHLGLDAANRTRREDEVGLHVLGVAKRLEDREPQLRRAGTGDTDNQPPRHFILLIETLSVDRRARRRPATGRRTPRPPTRAGAEQKFATDLPGPGRPMRIGRSLDRQDLSNRHLELILLEPSQRRGEHQGLVRDRH
jgi:hypothetical protein